MSTKPWTGVHHSEYSYRSPTRFTKDHEKSEKTQRALYQKHLIRKPSEVDKVDEKNDARNFEEKFRKNHSYSPGRTSPLSRLKTDERRSKLKPAKIPTRLKRQKINERMMKLLTPKDAVNVLHEMKPNCTYSTVELPNQEHASYAGFMIEVKDGDDVLGTGQGSSKHLAKSMAAENGIKTLFLRTMKTISEPKKYNSDDKDNWSVFPWTGLAQLAIYKMFNEWQLQESYCPTTDLQKLNNFYKVPKVVSDVNQTNKAIPKNARHLHPTTLLLQIHPHLNFIEVERTRGPPSRVKVGVEFCGQQFYGISSNKKEAKKEAAKLFLSTVYGINYES